MASKQVSPAAQLLRRSRVFALPPSLPRPSTKQGRSTFLMESDTATQHYPTDAAIETTSSSRARGDWGFKRPLPLKSTTRTSTPVVRVKDIDNIDHITDYESAAAYTVTLQKWQEINRPIWQYKPRYNFSDSDAHLARAGVFDVFEPQNQRSGQQSLQKPKRWRFGGPWLASMDNISFEKYVEKQIKTRRAEFRKYLWDHILGDKKQRAVEEATDHGEASEPQHVSLTEDEFQAEVIRLRQKKEGLWKILWKFLDLPGEMQVGIPAANSASQAPPVTHPSAGLSYLRTSSHVHNHALLGPQAQEPPVQCRILQRSRGPGGVTKTGGSLVGVGGIVASTTSNVFKHVEKGEVGRSNFQSHGGEKGYYEPHEASIDSYGRINLEVSRASEEAMAAWENEFVREDEAQKKEREDIKPLGEDIDLKTLIGDGGPIP